MLNYIRKNRFVKCIMVFMALNMLFNNIFLTNVFGNGPSQPEMQGPSASSVENMVDPFTGDFSYSVPLFEMGDIPLSLNYNGSVSMEQEASWVGLGWSLNPGSISRTVRGLPDDNYLDQITDIQHIRPNETVGVGVGGATEIVGMDFIKPKVSLNLTYNNYTGFDLGFTLSPSIKAGEHASLGLTIGSQSSNDFGDIGISPAFNFGKTVNMSESSDGNEKTDVTVTNTIGIGFSTNKGLQSISYGQKKIESTTKTTTGKDGIHYETTDKVLGSINVGASTSNMFNDQSFSPGIDHSFKNYQFSFRAGLGGDAVVADASMFLDGYYSAQFVEDETTLTPTYGYLYTDNASGDVLLDFNRESDGALQENTPVLSPSYMTYDIFSISSPGISGTFRAYRNDVGFVQENDVYGTSTSASFGGEFAIGNLISPGMDISATFGGSNSTEWLESNAVDDLLAYSNKKHFGSTKEKVYFAMMDEVTSESDPTFITKIGGKQPVEFNINGSGVATSLADNFDTYTGPMDVDITSDTKERSYRKTRNVDITYMTIGERKAYHPIQRHITYNDLNDMHIGQIMVTSADGTRYIYGLPVYNLEQYEVSFNVGKSGKDDEGATVDANNFVAYSDKQRGLKNESGIDHYYKETSTNAYAYSYLLTEVLSPDYVDVTGDGPSADDLGNYVKYTYGKDLDNNGTYEVNIPSYQWRTPITQSAFLANHFEGFRSDASDDKANFVYGTKEIWYLNKIETKDYCAKFNISARKDGFEVVGKDGDVGTVQVLQKLDYIELFSNAELQSLGEDAVPVKTVIFNYNNSLCQGYPLNNSGESGEEGKLTLLSVQYKYNSSNKAKHSYYEFVYASTISEDDDFENPDYGFTKNDRWGNYKPESAGELKNKYFPYVDQNDPNNNYYAAAWCLKKITTPTKGVIEITYESDDYAYVQNQQATQLIEVIGALSSPGVPTASNNLLYDYSIFDDELNLTNFNCLIFNVPDIPEDVDPDQYIKEAYILGDDLDPNNPVGVARNLYFKFSLNTNKLDYEGTEGYDYEFVSGYGELDIAGFPDDYAGVITDGGINYGYIRLKPESVRFGNTPIAKYERDVNPITKTGWQFCMQFVKYNILDQSPPGEPGDETFIQGMADIFFVSTILDFFRGPNNKMCQQDYANKFEIGKSWIRLQNPNGKKIGGGNRVKSIKIYDNWETMTDDEEGFSYGQEYTYTLEDNRSSGVAAYEPAMGGDENPMKRPFWYNHEPDKAYRYKMYKEKPFGENYFPAPVVGYSRVVVKNIEHDNVKRTATGKVVNEYYTAKDFPVRITYTSLDPVVFKPEPVLSLFKVASINSYTGSQGFCIETNNMHGKPKATEVYGEGQEEPLSKTTYHYKRDDSGHLNNWVKVINEDASIPAENYELGVTYDITLDFRKSVNWSVGGPIKGGLDAFTATIPFAIPSALAQYNFSNHTTKLAVTTKVINTNALIDYIETTQDGSTVKQFNNLYDSQTGAPIITSTQNEFNDNYYSMNYPAHWAIKGMDMACDNNGFTFQSLNSADKIEWATGRITDAGIIANLAPGDEIGIIGRNPDWREPAAFGNSALYCWVYEVNAGAATHGYYLIDRNGNTPDFSAIAGDFDSPDYTGVIQATVYRSGKRNMASNPVQSFVSKNEPIMAGFPTTVDESLGIISSSAIDYSQVWQKTCVPEDETGETYCECEETSIGQQFMDFLDEVFHTALVYSEVSDWPKINQEVLYLNSESEDVITENYYYDFFTMDLKNFFSGNSTETGYSTNLTVVAQNLVLDGDNLLHLEILHNPLTPFCHFECEFGVYNITEATLDLSDPAQFNDVFGNPEELAIEFEVTPAGCSDINFFTMTLHFIDINDDPATIEVNVSGYSDAIGCLTFYDCTEYTLAVNYCSGTINEHVNPYVNGLLGIWYPNVEYAYLTDRTPIEYPAITDIELRNNGTFEKFTPFWKWNDASNVWDKDVTNWVWTVQSKLRDPSIGQLQAINALDIPSSTLFGHNKTITEMIADNATYKTIGFENFEDNEYIGILEKACHQEHFDFSIAPGELTNKVAHTGNFSLKIPFAEIDGNSVTYTTVLTTSENATREEYPHPFTIDATDCIPTFEPEENMDVDVSYLVTFWAKQTFNNASPIFDFEDITLDVNLGVDELDVLITRSEIIEGWQRFECVFTIPAESEGELSISINNETNSNYIYIDDIRIMPQTAMAKCYVFDYQTQWLMAELDENHYTTFYEYDEDGKLVRVKKETEKGIMTIQEGRYFSVKRSH